MSKLVAQDIESVATLSGLQQSMLYRCQSEPGAGHYIEQLAFEFDDFNEAAMQRALDLLVRTHQALRTFFLWREQSVPKSITQSHAVRLIERLVSGQVDDEEKKRLLKEDRLRGIDLSNPPFMRFSVAQERTNDNTVYCIWTLHHAVVDGWSIVLLQQQLLDAYAHFKHSTDNTDSDVILAQVAKPGTGGSRITHGPGEHDLWEQALSNVDPSYALACLPPPISVVQSFAELGEDYGAQLASKLQQACRLHRVTFASFAQCAWGALLTHLNGSASTCFGMIDSGRSNFEDGDKLVGLYMQLQPVCFHLDERATVGEQLSNFQQAQWQLGEQLPPTPAGQAQFLGRSSGAHLFDTLLLVQNYPKATDVVGAGLRTTQGYEQADAPLVVSIAADDTLQILCRYQAHSLDRSSVINLQQAFVAMLESFANAPSTLSMLELLQQFSTSTAYESKTEPLSVSNAHSSDRCIDLFMQQLEAKPDTVALYTAEHSLSFSALAQRAEVIRQVLAEQKVVAGDVIGVYGSRSLNTVASMLAVLAQGAIIMPLDARHSTQYVDQMVQRSGAKLVLIDSANQLQFQAACCVWLEGVALNEERGALEIQPRQQGANQGMCLMHTSGSTGEPKAVMLSHESVVNRLRWLDAEYPVSESERYCHRTPLSFVDSIAEIFTPLCNGSSARVVNDEELLSLNRFVEILSESNISRLTIVPSLLAPLVDAAVAMNVNLDKLGLIISSGEVLTVNLAQKVKQQLPHCRLLNLYGSTEVCADAVFYELADPSALLSTTVPIGHPIAGMTAEVCNARGYALPAGFIGELKLSGIGVAEQYTVTPSTKSNTQRGVFRTGDRAYFNEWNVLQFVGRVDRQLKIRGQRIEPAAVESAISSHPQVVACAVCTTDDKLHCYYTAAKAIDASLRDFAKSRLPDHCVPHRFVLCDELPTLPSGKLDYALLQNLGADRLASPNEIDPQLNLHQRELMATVANIWQPLFPHADVGPSSDFFEIGGHSLLAMEMTAQLERALGMEIPLSILMKNSRLDAFSQALFSDIPREAAPELITLSAGDSSNNANTAVFCLQGDAYNIVPHLNDGRAIYWISQWSICVDLVRDPVPVAVESIEQTALRYADHIESKCENQPFVLLAACGAAVIAIEAARVLESRGLTCRRLFLMDLPRGELTTAAERGFGERQGKNVFHSAYGFFMRVGGGSKLLAWYERRRIERKVQNRQPLSDVEAAHLMHLRLSEALAQYEPSQFQLPIEMILSRAWYRGVNHSDNAQVPKFWRPYLGSVAKIHFAPAEHHGDLLAPKSAQFIAQLIAQSD